MRSIKNLNTIAIAIPLCIALLGIIFREMLIIAAFSIILTGFIQTFIGLILWATKPKNIYLIIYLLGVILFFTLNSYTPFTKYIYILPIALCIYLTIIIHTFKE
jgi:hypothetical protein